MKNKPVEKKVEWDEKDIRWLSQYSLKVLRAFVSKGKTTLTSDEIKTFLNLKGENPDKIFGAIMGTFGKYSKKPLLSPVLRLAGRKKLWAIDEKTLPLIKKVLGKIEKYL